MAKSRPSLGGIFRLKGKNDSKIQLTGMSTYGDDTSVSSPTGDTRFAQKFTQFGNYKPKIFSGQNSATPSGNDGKSEESEVPRPSTSGTNSKDKVSTPSSGGHYIVPTFSDRASDKSNDSGKVTKESNTEPSDNFILIGDKDKPMILESGNDSLSLDGSELPDELPGDHNVVESVVKESRTAEEENMSVYMEPDEIIKPEPKEAKEMGGIRVGDFDSYLSSNESSQYADVDESRVRSSKPNIRPEGAPMELPYIPPPDYDEEVMTIDMSDEDDSHDPQPSEQRGLSSRRVYRVYQGDDFGQYLEEEESIYQTPSDRSARRNIKRQPKRTKKQNKETSKSITGTITRAIFGSSHDEDTLKRRTIHEVSYENSKMSYSNGRPNGVQGSRSEGRYYRADGLHSPRDNRQSNYEQFLISRHTKSGSLESTSDSEMETSDDNRNIGNMDSHSHYLTTTGAYSSPNKYIKKNGIWKKLTLRFRRRSQGEAGTVN